MDKKDKSTTADGNPLVDQARSRLQIINNLAVEIIGIANQTDLAWYVAREVVGRLGFVDCVIYYLDPGGNSLYQVAAFGTKNPRIDEIINPLQIPLGQGITGTVAETRTPLMVNDLSQNKLYIADIDAALSELCVPLVAGEKVYGVIDCEHPDRNHFTMEHREVLTTVASLTSAKLRFIEQNEHFKLMNELRFGEDRFRDFVEIASDWYWELDEDLRYTYYSSKKEKDKNYASDFFLGKRRSEVKPDTLDSAQWQSHLDELNARRPFRNFIQSRTGRDGKLIWQSVSGKPWFDDRGLFRGYRGTVSDITDHMDAEAQLRQSEARFRSMSNSSSVAMNIAIDQKGNIIYWNRAAELTFGYQEREILGQPVTGLMPERFRKAHNQGRQRALQTDDHKIIGTTVELVGLKKNGDEFEIELSLGTWYQGSEKFFSAVLHDISARKRVERQLIDSQQKAEAANQAKSEFLAAMSHELRTPLTSSIGSLGLISNLMADDIPDQGKELLEIAIRNNEALLRLVNELLDYEKIQSGHFEIETQRCDICDLTRTTVVDNQGFASANSVKLMLSELPASLFAQVHKHRFEQVLANLLSNACKFSEPGRDVEIRVEQLGSRVRVEVKDYGAGIPEQFRPNIFEPFSQADASSTRLHGGTGLGLSISKALTEGMGGTLDFKSQVDVGSRFFIEFPVVE